MEKFMAEGFDLLNVASIGQDSSEGPTDLLGCSSKKQGNARNGISENVAAFMLEKNR